PCISRVARESIEPRGWPGIAKLLFDLRQPAEFELCLPFCTLRRHTTRDQITDVLLDVKPKLSFQLLIASPPEPRSKTLHDAIPLPSTRAQWPLRGVPNLSAHVRAVSVRL